MAFEGITNPTDDQFLAALMHAEAQHAQVELARGFRLFMEALSKIKS